MWCCEGQKPWLWLFSQETFLGWGGTGVKMLPAMCFLLLFGQDKACHSCSLDVEVSVVMCVAPLQQSWGPHLPWRCPGCGRLPILRHFLLSLPQESCSHSCTGPFQLMIDYNMYYAMYFYCQYVTNTKLTKHFCKMWADTSSDVTEI